MSIFLILLFSLLIGMLLGAITMLGYALTDENRWITISVVVCLVMAFVVGPIIGVWANTDTERINVQKYLAQKETIESSLQSDILTGFERAELVNKAASLNGWLAEQKTKFNIWHYVYFDNSIYDGVDPIKIN